MEPPAPPPAPEKPREADLPPRDGDAPLHELGRDPLSVLLYVSFTGEELAELMRAIGVHVPGFRVESLGDAEKADIIADEIRARPAARAPVIAQLGKIYEFPALEGVALPAVVAREIGALAVEGDATVRMLWRLLADPSPEVRAQAKEPLDALVKSYYAPAPEGAAEGVAAQEGARPSGPSGGGSRNASAALASEARRARAEAERTKAKVAELKAQLKSARAELAEAQKHAATHRKAHDRMAEKLERAELSAKEAKARPARAELDRALKEAADLAARASALEERERRAVEERDALRAEVEKARKALDEERAPKPAAASPVEGEGLQEVPSTWFLPRFSPEFYDSLQGWDPRIQRAAFKQAYLLAENHRHPSLRAIPLEGLPGYYRVRIATDVRLIYRRVGEKEFEILSLIDREDLDRYVRQAKTR